MSRFFKKVFSYLGTEFRSNVTNFTTNHNFPVASSGVCYSPLQNFMIFRGWSDWRSSYGSINLQRFTRFLENSSNRRCINIPVAKMNRSSEFGVKGSNLVSRTLNTNEKRMKIWIPRTHNLHQIYGLFLWCDADLFNCQYLDKMSINPEAIYSCHSQA